MSRLIFDKKDHRPLVYVDDYKWTTDRLKDEFFLCLVKTADAKYYNQARNLMYRIPLTEQYPKSEEESVPFIICFDDLSSQVQAEFRKYCVLYNKKQVSLFLKDTVIRLFENLDFEYAHKSIMRKLRIRLVKL